MKRISNIHTTEEVELERQRERLRDWRWRRHKSKVYVGLCAIAVLSAVLLDGGAAEAIRLLPIR